MRRIFNYTLFFLLSLTIVLVMPKTIVKADACSYKEQAALNKEAKNIKKSYEFIEDDPLNYHFKIYLTNITDKIILANAVISGKNLPFLNSPNVFL